MKIWKEILTDLQIKNLSVYVEALCYFNKMIPLYSRKRGKTFCQELILDSILAGQILLKDSNHELISDIGSGAGLPGLVLATLDAKRNFWLFEPNKKKAEFLNYTCWKMNLKNVQVKDIPIQQEKTLLKCAVSKAFLSLDERLFLTRSQFGEDSFYYHLQTADWQKTWKNSRTKVKKIWQLQEVKSYSHPLLPGIKVLLKAIKKQS